MSIMVLAKRGSAASRYEMFERKDMLLGHGPEREESKRWPGYKHGMVRDLQQD
jgi:hypothetical protein